MPEEYRVIGPPGCGKTTYIKDQVERAVHAQGSRSVLLASLTNAAAKELSGRVHSIPKSAIDTIHSHARRSACAELKLATEPGTLKQWNDSHPGVWKMEGKGKRSDLQDGVTGSFYGKEPGNEIHEKYSTYRSQMKPRELWDAQLLHFAKEWEGFKSETNTIDFVDMISIAIENTIHAPGNPAFIFLDEAQDVDRLQFTLIRQWAEHAIKLIVVGDPWQNLYEWRGTSPDTMTTPELPKDNMRVLRQSYRVPRAVHKLACKWIARHKGFVKYDYDPRDYEGEVRHICCDQSYPHSLVLDIEKYIQAGKSVMILASYSRALCQTIDELKAAGIPFHNKYKLDNGAWNQYRHRTKVLDYLQTDSELWGEEAGLWTWSQLHNWLKDFEVEGFLCRGAKAMTQRNAEADGTRDLALTTQDVERVFLPHACEINDLEWYREKRMAKKKEVAATDYILNVAKKRGKLQLTKEPLVTTGTIHSVKGGQADVVYLFPNLSSFALKHIHNPGDQQYSEIIRQFYVGVTRARETLIICDQLRSARNSIPIGMLS